jgi:hypothetical protein
MLDNVMRYHSNKREYKGVFKFAMASLVIVTAFILITRILGRM